MNRAARGKPERKKGVRFLRGVSAVRLDRTRGRGTALREAMARAAGMGATHLLAMDADGAYSAKAIAALVKEAKTHPEAIVIGARRAVRPHARDIVAVGRRLSGLWVKVQTGAWIPDARSGLRV